MTRMIGTGKDPENRYPEGLVYDATPEQADEHEELGLGKRQDPADDAGRSKRQIAEAIVRGDTLSHPEDAKIAEDFIGFGDNPDKGEDPYDYVTEQEGLGTGAGSGSKKDSSTTGRPTPAVTKTETAKSGDALNRAGDDSKDD